MTSIDTPGERDHTASVVRAVRSPFDVDDPVRSLGLAWVLAPALAPTLGYAVRIARSAVGGRRSGPAYEHGDAVVRDGLGALVLTLAHVVPVWIALVVDANDLFAGMLTAVVVILYPASLTRYAADGMPAALQVTTTIDIVLTRAYLRTWLGSATLTVVAGLATWMIATRGPWWLGTLVGWPVAVYVLLVVARLHGQQYRALLGSGPGVEDGTAPVPM